MTPKTLSAETLLGLVVASHGGRVRASTLPLVARKVPEVHVTHDERTRDFVLLTEHVVAPELMKVNWRSAFRGGGQE